MKTISELFNNREIATALWLLLLGIYFLSKPSIRKSFHDLIRSALQRPLLYGLGLMILYVALMVGLLWKIGVWDIGLLKDTVFWFCFGGLAIVFRFADFEIESNDHIFRKIFSDSVKIVILLEFLINSYTFPLLVELLFVPFVTTVILVDAVARGDSEYANTAKFTGTLTAALGLLVVLLTIFSAITDYENIGTFDTLRRVSLPPLLSIGLSPFIYFLVAYMTYELIFVQLRLGKEKKTHVTRYAKRRTIMKFGLNLKKLEEFRQRHARKFGHVQTADDVNRVLSHVDEC